MDQNREVTATFGPVPTTPEPLAIRRLSIRIDRFRVLIVVAVHCVRVSGGGDSSARICFMPTSDTRLMWWP